MGSLRYFVFLVLITSVVCRHPHPADHGDDILIDHADTITAKELADKGGRGALLLTRFNSLEDLKTVVQFQYGDGMSDTARIMKGKPKVCLTNRCGTREVTSILESGISESDFNRARDGNIWDILRLVIFSPYTVMNGKDLVRIEILGRRRYEMFGKGDVAFYDLAEAMVKNITEKDVMWIPAEDLSEKGYLNTFNHILAQCFMTSIFSESIADFVADVHERHTMPELITGRFTEDQLANLEKGPLDNYIDMINNEWGQELGKSLREKYSIRRKTHWDPDLLANYLNDIQKYHNWVFQIGFKPFRPTDEIVIHFANKINIVIEDVARLKNFYN